MRKGKPVQSTGGNFGTLVPERFRRPATIRPAVPVDPARQVRAGQLLHGIPRPRASDRDLRIEAEANRIEVERLLKAWKWNRAKLLRLVFGPGLGVGVSDAKV